MKGSSSSLCPPNQLFIVLRGLKMKFEVQCLLNKKNTHTKMFKIYLLLTLVTWISLGDSDPSPCWSHFGSDDIWNFEKCESDFIRLFLNQTLLNESLLIRLDLWSFRNETPGVKLKYAIVSVSTHQHGISQIQPPGWKGDICWLSLL